MTSVQQTFDLAVQHHRAGNLQQAEQYYRQILQAEPHHANALHLLGVIAHQVGRGELALDYISQALRLQPNFAEAYSNRGLVFKAQGKLNEAVANYEQALRLRPDFAEAYNNLGIALGEQGKLEQATASYRRALHLKPDYAEAHNNLGIVLSEQEAFDDGIASYRQALRLNPNFAEAHNNLGATLKDQGKLDDAIANYQRALQLRPGYAEAHNNLGIAFKEQGNLEGAITCFHEALRCKPDLAPAWWHLGQVMDLRSADIGQLQTLLASPHLPRPYRSDLHRTLAVWLEQRQDYHAAFRNYRQANDLMKQELQQTGRAFDRLAFRAVVDQQIAAFDEAFFRQRRPAVTTTELPIFVVGMPRSGTTLVEQILSSHSHVAGAGELYYVAQMVSTLERTSACLGGYPACLQSLDPAYLRDQANRYLGRLIQIDSRASRIIDKMPGNLLHLGLIALLFPQARVIHCRRDPLDVCLSCYFQNLSRIAYKWSLEDLGFYHQQYERLMAHWQRVLPMRMLEVRYEDLVMQQETVSRSLVAFCGLEWEDSCQTFYKNPRPVHTASALQVRRPIYSTSMGRWRHYETFLDPLRKALGLPSAEGASPAPMHQAQGERQEVM